MRVLYPQKHPFCTTSIPLVIGVSFTTLPNTDVTVTITGDSVTTASDTLTPDECLAGVAIPVYASTTSAGKLPCTLTISATGGETSSTTIQAYISNGTEEVNSKWTVYMCLTDGVANWRREYPTFTNVTTKRNELRTDIFGSSSLPTGAPYATSSSTSVNGVNLANAKNAASYKVDFRMNDPDGYYWESSFGYVQNSDNLGVLVIDHLGHGEPGHDTLYSSLMSAGYDYANCALANATNNPLITESFPTTRHNQILNQGIDREGFDGRQLFLFDKVRFIDWVVTQRSYSKIILCGVSGGGQMAALWGGIDSRLDKVFAVRGTGAQGQPYGSGDFEQGPGTLDDYLNETGSSIGAVASPRVAASMRDHSRLDWFSLKAAEGEFHLMTHPDDTCCWKGWYNQMFGQDLTDYATDNFGGSYNTFFNTETGETTHGYQAADITYILANI